MKIKSGSIPKELTYFIAAPQKITVSWENVELEEGETEKVEEVYPTFVSDSSNAKTLATGKTWATNASRTYDRATSSYVTGQSKEITRANDPITKLRIFALDYRGNGGRAWKCADENGYYFDLREDVLLDLMRTVGISEGGYLNGEYIWAKIHAEMKLVRIGSDLHAALEAATDRREKKFIPRKELKPWHLYQQKNGTVLLCVGQVSGFRSTQNVYALNKTQEDTRWADWFVAKQENDKTGNNWQREQYLRSYKTLNEPPKPAKIEIKYTEFTQPLWISIDWNDSKSVAENLKVLELAKDSIISTKVRGSYYGFSHLLSFDPDKKVVNELGKLEIPSVFEQIRLESVHEVTEKLSGPHKTSHLDRLTTERYRLVIVASLLEYGTIYPAGGEMDPSYDFWITEIISKEP